MKSAKKPLKSGGEEKYFDDWLDYCYDGGSFGRMRSKKFRTFAGMVTGLAGISYLRIFKL